VRFEETCAPVEEDQTQDQNARVHSLPPASSALGVVPSEALRTADSSTTHSLSLPLPAPPHPPPPPPPSEAPLPPTIFNKALETNKYLNAAAVRLYTHFMNELSDFVTQQGEVVSMRVAVQERRKELHTLRERVSRCDMMLINCVREQMNGGMAPNKHTTLKHFEASQAARDLIGPVESEYEPLEVLLGSKEHLLVEKYSRLEKTFEHFFRLSIAPATKPKEPSEIEYEASSADSVVDEGAAPGGTDHLHGAFIGENVGIGQHPRHSGELKPTIEERWVPGALHRRSMSLDSTDVARPSRTTSEDGNIFACNSTGTLDHIGLWITDMIDLAEPGATFSHGSRIASGMFGSSHIEIPDELPDLANDLPVNPGLDEGNPLLLLDESNETRAILSDYLVNFESTPDRVNRWMLHHLRVSPREIYTLHRHITKLTSEPLRWATSVLKQWPHDNFGQNNPFDQGSAELEENFLNPQVLGYHGACDPECRDTHPWPDKDAWLEPKSSNFSTAETAPTRPAHLDTEANMSTVHELSTEYNDGD